MKSTKGPHPLSPICTEGGATQQQNIKNTVSYTYQSMQRGEK